MTKSCLSCKHFKVNMFVKPCNYCCRLANHEYADTLKAAMQKPLKEDKGYA